MRFFRMTNREPWTKIDDAVFLGCRLRNRDESRSDNNLQIDSVLDLTSEFNEVAALRRLPYCCIPLLDTNAPSPAQLKCGVGWIIDNAQRGNVYVHCALGHGRSATFVVAYLMTTQHQTFDEALQIVQRLRRGIQLSKAQHRVLEVWNRSL